MFSISNLLLLLPSSYLTINLHQNPLSAHISLQPFIVLLPSNFVSRRVERRKKNKDGESSHEIETWNLLRSPDEFREEWTTFGSSFDCRRHFSLSTNMSLKKQETDLNACPRSLDILKSCFHLSETLFEEGERLGRGKGRRPRHCQGWIWSRNTFPFLSSSSSGQVLNSTFHLFLFECFGIIIWILRKYIKGL